MMPTPRHPMLAAAVVALVLGFLTGAAPSSAAQAAAPCCAVVQLASVGALPDGFPAALAVSLARPSGYAAGARASFVAAKGTGMITYSVGAAAMSASGAAPRDGLRAAALTAVGAGARSVDTAVTVRHDVLPAGGASRPVGVGSLPGYELIVRAAAPGTFSGALAFVLSPGPGAPVVVVRMTSAVPCCDAPALQALRAALDGVALVGNLPVTRVEAMLSASRAAPCCDAVLTGTVADAFGEPVVGVTVSLAPAGATPCCSGATDVFGTYVLGLPRSLHSGGYTLTVDDADACCTMTRALDLDLARPAAAPAAAVNLLDPNLRWVVSRPRVVNLFWDSSWGKHNSWSRHTIDVATRDLVVSHYFDDVVEYGVRRPRWVGSHSPSVLCGNRRAPRTLTSARLLAWITCEVSTLLPSPRLPVSNDLFVVYLPERTTVKDVSLPKLSVLGRSFGPFSLPRQCIGWSGFHFASLSLSGPFAFAVVASRCANGALRELTETASHELVETMTDPVVTAGWIDDSYSLAPPAFDRLLKGEAADICEPVGAHPTPPVSVMSGRYLIAPYWSNAAGVCVAHF